MDILFIVHDANLHGGTEILTFNLLHGLRGLGKDAWVLSLVPYVGRDEYVLSLSHEEYARWNKVACSIGNKLMFSILSDCELRNILLKKIKELEPTMIVNQNYDNITALPIVEQTVQVFNWSVKGFESSLSSAIRQLSLPRRVISSICECGKRYRRHRMLSRIPKLVLLSEAAKREIKTLNANVREDQTVVIPDPLTVKGDSPRHSTLKNNNIVFVGRLSQEKGVMRLLRIWESICLRLPGYSLSVYGEGSAKPEMMDYIREHKLPGIKLKGYCDDLEDIYIGSDLLLMTSDTEGFGMVLIEAMYFGVPCISFDCPVSPQEIIADAGLTVECFDEDKYADAVIELLQNPERLKYLQQKSIERARDFYMDVVLDKWMKLLPQI